MFSYGVKRGVDEKTEKNTKGAEADAMVILTKQGCLVVLAKSPKATADALNVVFNLRQPNKGCLEASVSSQTQSTSASSSQMERSPSADSRCGRSVLSFYGSSRPANNSCGYPGRLCP